MEAFNTKHIGHQSFDFIVIGVGSMGSAACYHLAKKGYKVLGLEQYDITHELGSHTGQSRIIRKAYFEHADYVPLLHRAYQGWHELELETDTQLYFRTGLLYSGHPDHILIRGVENSASLFNIPLLHLSSGELANSFPQFRIPSNFKILLEPDAGFVTPERAIKLLVQQAIRKGAVIQTGEKVLAWKKDGAGCRVTTSANTYSCNKLIITAGAWAGNMIPGLGKKIKITRQFIAWIKPHRENDFKPGQFPCWMIADDNKPGAFYGFPFLEETEFGKPSGLKLAYHYPGSDCVPDAVNREATNADKENLVYALRKYLPGCPDSVLTHKICLYANTPDENFIIDQLPGYEEHVVIACGFSGHGFKFVPVVGEILTALASESKSDYNINFLSARRFQ